MNTDLKVSIKHIHRLLLLLLLPELQLVTLKVITTIMQICGSITGAATKMHTITSTYTLVCRMAVQPRAVTNSRQHP